MRLTLAAAALAVAGGAALALNGAALAQGTTSSPAAAPPSTTVPAGMPPAGATPPGGQTPAATMNTTPQSASANPSAIQTRNTMHRTAAAPVPGRNSFTHSQAARRIAAAGFTKVSGLTKDSQGIWRGKAEKDGAPTSVSLDYQGNVTAQ
jgi:hypothetical protein